VEDAGPSGEILAPDLAAAGAAIGRFDAVGAADKDLAGVAVGRVEVEARRLQSRATAAGRVTPLDDSRHTGGDLERADACLPVEAGGLIILIGVPEGAVVGRVHAHTAVVAPANARGAAAVAGLRAGVRAGGHRGLALRQRVQRVG